MLSGSRGEELAEELICPQPPEVPPDLAAVSRGYRARVALALFALLSFIALYVALTGWFAWSACRIAATAFGEDSRSGLSFLWSLPLAFLALFMLKALFFRSKSDLAGALEIDAASEPRLFTFLHGIADQVGAPRPHRVFLSSRVNAGVFYDVSILNIIFPSRKNLDIGLGVINALTLGEVRAVLAHEFGHFAQGAMAVGRWVFVAQRVAAHIVHTRDRWDRVLHSLSVADLRVAWLGWAMRLVVWALRAVMDSVFSVVVRVQRALEHEMERQADLVAVTLAGSDAPVNALHKLQAADMAWDGAVGIAAERLAKGELVDDLFAMQSRVLEHHRRVLADETHGVAPPLPTEGRARHRVFQERIAHPPRMWSSHPPNREREDNMKRTYVPCDLDDRPAWLLFRDPVATRARATNAALARLPQPEGETRRLTREESLQAVDGCFDHAYYDPRYRGLYLERSAVLGAKTVADLYVAPDSAADLSLDKLYPESLGRALETWKTLEVEFHALLGLERGVLQSAGTEIKFRGEVLRRRELAKKLKIVSSEREAARAAVAAYDRQNRSAHLAAAERVGHGWPEYLRSLAALLHYADHVGADLRDARASLATAFAMATAGGRITSAARIRVATAGADVHGTMLAIWEQRAEVILPAAVAASLGVEVWATALPQEFQLGLPDPDQLGRWLEVIDGWLNAFIRPLAALTRCTLEALLRAEAQVAAFDREPAQVTAAPSPAATPARYSTLVPGSERERRWHLGWWERFQAANGVVPSLARFAVAAALVAAIIRLGTSVGDSRIVVYNGLGRDVVVRLADQTYTLSPFQKMSVDGLADQNLRVVTSTTAGDRIEDFEVSVSHDFRQYVYNVSGAAPLVRWTAVYGNVDGAQPRQLGAPRWTTTDATILFERPPPSVSTRHSGGTSLAVLTALADRPPTEALSSVDDRASRAQVVRAHATWDLPTRPTTSAWLRQAYELPDFADIVRTRLTLDPGDVPTMRAEQDQPDQAAKAAACVRQTRLAQSDPHDADLQYLAIRCQPAGPARDEATLAAQAQAPQNVWLAFSAGYVHARRSEWSAALASWATARASTALADRMAIESARVLRLLGPASASDLQALAEQSTDLRHALALENGTGSETIQGPASAYAKLVSGALNDAVEAAGDDAVTRARVVRLVAASRGATAAQIAAAGALPADAGLDVHTIWAAIGVALRDKQDATALLARMQQFIDPSEAIAYQAFLHPERLAADEKAAAAAVSALDPLERGHAYVLGTVILGDAAPETWRTQARALLFAHERPFL